MFIRIRLDYNGEDYGFAINGLYSSILNGKQEGEAYICGLDAEIWLNVGDGWMLLSKIEQKFKNEIQKAEKELLDLEKERLELRLTQVKHMMGE
jgi:hypothetical protein